MSNVENNTIFNPQKDDMEFITDDGFVQAGIVDLTACFDGYLQCKAENEQAEKSKISMESGNILFDGFNNIDDEIFESSGMHADTPKGITA